MNAVLTALGPVFVLIMAGYALRRAGFPERRPGGKFSRLVGGQRLWPFAEALTYYLLLPSLLFHSLARATFDASAVGPIAASLSGTILIIGGATLLLRPWLGLSGPSFGSVFQGVIRPNTYVGVAPVFALWGADGLALLAIAIVSVIPLVNLLSVIVVSRTGERGAPPPSPLALIGLVVRNPLIVACCLGLAASLAGLPLPDWLQLLLTALGTAAMPVGLLTVGAALDLQALRGAVPTIIATSITKLVLFPLVAGLIGMSSGLSGVAIGVVLLYGGLPISASAYVLARLLGGDATLVAGTLTATTLAAFATMPMIILLLPHLP